MKTMALEEANFIRDIVFETVEVNPNIEIEFFDADGVCVEYDGQKARIGADQRVGFARGCFLLAMELESGKERISIQERAHFKGCGVTLDCSRNGVMTLKALKRYMNILASLGFNILVLYTEDVFEIKNRPRFGYMRGRYTHEDIREIVAYGEQLGIEVVPAIQVLGHLTQYLKYAKTCNNAVNFDTGERINEIMNTHDTLLIGCEETYQFIEDMVRTCRELYHSSKIKVNADEADNAFVGKFLKLHGQQPKHEVLNKHLARVVEICKKYGFTPIVPPDTYFRAYSPTGTYWDPNTTFPAEARNAIPDIELSYWDYRAAEPEEFEKMLKKVAELRKPIHFMGALHTWVSPLPCFAAAWGNGKGGLSACLKHNIIDTAFTSIWGDDGTLCNAFLANPLLPIMTERCYKGEACTDEDIRRASEFLTKIPFAVTEVMGDANCIVDPENGWRLNAKRLLFGDILYDMSIDLVHCDAVLKTYAEHAKMMQKQMDLHDKNYEYYRYAWLIFEVGLKKAELRKNLQKAYLEHDTAYLRYVAEELLPELAGTMEELRDCHKKQWVSTYKMFGYEVHCFRYGGMIARIQEIAERISQYLSGEIEAIEELEAERIPNGLSYYTVHELITPSSIS